jgi:hypothetical protein
MLPAAQDYQMTMVLIDLGYVGKYEHRDDHITLRLSVDKWRSSLSAAGASALFYNNYTQFLAPATHRKAF